MLNQFVSFVDCLGDYHMLSRGDNYCKHDPAEVGVHHTYCARVMCSQGVIATVALFCLLCFVLLTFVSCAFMLRSLLSIVFPIHCIVPKLLYELYKNGLRCREA